MIGNKILGRLLAAICTAILLASSSHAALLGRDINGNAVAGSDASSVFLYDTDRNITWLRDANVNGFMLWDAANTWANGYSIGAFSDWRLPTMTTTGSNLCEFSAAGGTNCGYNVDTTTGEIAHLWYDELPGNLAYCPPGGDPSCVGGPQPGWGLTNPGDFLNMQADYYWYGTSFASRGFVNSSFSHFHTDFGYQGSNPNFFAMFTQYGFAMAVRDGDVLRNQVPEPESLLLALTALGAMALVRRRRAVRASAA